MSTALAIITPETTSQLERTAKMLASSSLVPRQLQGKPADVFLIILTGAELGMPPTAALRSIYVVQGKPVMSAALIMRLAKNLPECEYFGMVESDDTKATYKTKQRGSDSYESLTFTIEQAKKAGLTSKDNWRKHPADMLRARCIAKLARAVYGEVFGGMYEQDEAEDFAKPAEVKRFVRQMSEPDATEVPQFDDGESVQPRPVVVPSDSTYQDFSKRIAEATTREQLLSVGRDFAKLNAPQDDRYKNLKQLYFRKQMLLDNKGEEDNA